VVLFASSLVLVAAGVLGVFNPGHFVWVERLLDHPFVFGVVAALSLARACWMLIPWPWVEVPLVVAAGVVALLWGLLGVVFFSVFDEPEVLSLPAPEGAGASYELVVRQGDDDIIDVGWMLTIRQTDGLLAREWDLGCMTNDAGWKPAHKIRWLDRGHLVVQSDVGGAFNVDVDPESGEPVSPGDLPWTCQGGD
jgi:hypothetical protein